MTCGFLCGVAIVCVGLVGLFVFNRSYAVFGVFVFRFARFPGSWIYLVMVLLVFALRMFVLVGWMVCLLGFLVCLCVE